MAGGKPSEEKPAEAKIDPTFPYFLGSQDNPSNTITQIKLCGENYDEWSRSIRLALQARRKFGFVDGTITKRTDETRLDDWYTVHSMIVSWIMTTIDPSVKSTISYYKDAKLLWDDLKERFCVVNGLRVLQLKAALADCKQSKNKPVVSYYRRLKHIWDALSTFEPIPGCECGGCTCNIGKRLETRYGEERLHQFLLGLDVGMYGTVHSNILSQQPLPSLNRAYQTVIQEECVQSVTRLKEDMQDKMAFTMQTHGRGIYEVQVKNLTLFEIEKILIRNNLSLKEFEGMPYPDDVSIQSLNNRLIAEELDYDIDNQEK